MILEKNIEELQLNNKIINKLKEKDIRIIKDLWKMKRKELKQDILINVKPKFSLYIFYFFQTKLIFYNSFSM